MKRKRNENGQQSNAFTNNIVGVLVEGEPTATTGHTDAFYSCNLDLERMTLIQERDLKMYLHIKN